MTLMPLTARAQNSVSTVTTTENITKTSTVYVGEVVVDGVTQIKYLYSGDISIYSYVIQNLLDGLNGMADSDYATLLDKHEFDYTGETVPDGFAICSDPDLVEYMDENWSSALYVGALCYPNKYITSEINSNLYDIDEGFKAALDAQTQKRTEDIDTPADAEKCFVFHLDARTSTNIWYTIEDGQVVRHSNITIIHDSEATTVIYTKVELGTSQSGSVLGDVNGDGEVNVTDVTMIVEYVLGQHNSSFIAANADVNGDGSITVTDVAEAVNIILGDNRPQSYLTCPDNNHPHMIDLGLPSGTKWACCNVGADKPEKNGGFYAWGETEEKEVYDWSTYIHCNGSRNTCNNLGGDIAGTQYDVAHVQWGGSWMMPSKKQQDELINNCTSTWTTQNGVNGKLFTGTNGYSIFLPAAGHRSESGLYASGYIGNYWSSTQHGSSSESAFYMYFVSPEIFEVDFDTFPRCDGRSIRPVSR